ncbi:MAG: glycogen synthase [Gemmatimonadota bacterium]|nr:glycogen synthase [Gemmatimonadota bacterium]
MVHLATEYWPYARTGGLAEAVRGIATYQARAGRKTSVFMPLYRRVRESAAELRAVGDGFEVPTSRGPEWARIFEDAAVGEEGPSVYFVEHDGFFDRPGLYGEGHDYPDNHLRFSFFCRAVLQCLPRFGDAPVLIHPHDWHTALAPVYLRTVLADDPFYDDVASVLTVHNAGYQGHYPPEALAELGLGMELFTLDRMEWYGNVNLLKGGLVFADMVTTVSPTHAHELRTHTGGFGLHDTFNQLQDRFVGILNGIDYEVWNPASDPAIEAPYTAEDLSGKDRCKVWFQKRLGLTPDPTAPLFAMSARLVEQKGLDIILGAEMIPRLDAQWAFLGEGEARYQEAIARLATQAPDRIGHSFSFTEEREHKLLAAADFLLMPSLYEPCGLTQMRAQRYGALPVARRVGGLTDTVEDRITGFLFDEYQPWALEEVVGYAIDLYRNRAAWEERVRSAMERDFSWDRSAAEYGDVYEAARNHRRWIVEGGGGEEERES